MRRGVRPRMLWPLTLAALLSVGASVGLQRAGEIAQIVVLFVLLTLAFFVAINLLLSVPIRRSRFGMPPDGGRGRIRGGGWDPSGRGNGWDTSGTREPRRPRPPLMPSRAEALDPDSVAPEA
jgi:hypothetical protein